MPSIRTRALAGGALLAALAPAALPAAASAAPRRNVVIEVQIQGRYFQKDPDVKAVVNPHPKTRAQVETLLRTYRRLEGRFRAASTAVSHSTANNATQRKGRTQYVSATRSFANGLHRFEGGLEDLIKGEKTTAKKQIVASDKQLKTATKGIQTAEHTLGLR